MKTVYCSGCNTKVAEIANGSQLKKGFVMLCSSCEDKRIASDIAKTFKPKPSYADTFGDMFGGGSDKKPFWES